MFDPIPAFTDKGTAELVSTAGDPSRSVSVRGGALAELGRRVNSEPDLVDRLLQWAEDPEFKSARLAGFVTLSWVALAGVARSQSDPEVRGRLRAAVDRLKQEDRNLLFSWARHESWFDDMR